MFLCAEPQSRGCRASGTEHAAVALKLALEGFLLPALQALAQLRASTLIYRSAHTEQLSLALAEPHPPKYIQALAIGHIGEVQAPHQHTTFKTCYKARSGKHRTFLSCFYVYYLLISIFNHGCSQTELWLTNGSYASLDCGGKKC